MHNHVHEESTHWKLSDGKNWWKKIRCLRTSKKFQWTLCNATSCNNINTNYNFMTRNAPRERVRARGPQTWGEIGGKFDKDKSFVRNTYSMNKYRYKFVEKYLFVKFKLRLSVDTHKHTHTLTHTVAWSISPVLTQKILSQGLYCQTANKPAIQPVSQPVSHSHAWKLPIKATMLDDYRLAARGWRHTNSNCHHHPVALKATTIVERDMNCS